MVQLLQSSTRTVAIVLITIAAWLLASNHCALAAWASKIEQSAEHGCCHAGKGKTLESDVLCCDALTALVPTPNTAPPIQLMELMLAWNSTPLYALVPPNTLPVHFLPPKVRIPISSSFAVLVLNESLLAHAPAFFTV